MNPTPLEHYARLFGNLHTDREGDRPRPHKPVMLLSVLALAEAGRLADGCIRYSPDLLEIFGRFFEAVRDVRRALHAGRRDPGRRRPPDSVCGVSR